MAPKPETLRPRTASDHLPPTPQEAALTFMLALHRMYVAVFAARKLLDQQQRALFSGHKLSSGLCAHPYHELVGPLPRQ